MDYESVIYGDYKYPGWADGMGWMMALASALMIPITMVYKVYKENDAIGMLSVSSSSNTYINRGDITAQMLMLFTSSHVPPK